MPRALALILLLALPVAAATPPAGGTDAPLVQHALEVISARFVDGARAQRPALLAVAGRAMGAAAGLSSGQREHAAVRAMVESLNDRYSRFLPPEPLHQLQTTLSGHFGGVGMRVRGLPGGGLEVVSAVDGSPAARAGARAGDRVVRIDGVDVSRMPGASVIEKLRGEKGTRVRVGLLRGGSAQPVEMALVREEIEVPTVRTSRPEPGIAVLAIERFGETTSEEVMLALERLQVEQLGGLVIDLRDDPGGLLQTAVDVGHLLLGDVPIVSVKGRAPDEQVLSTIARNGKAQPLVVVLDGGMNTVPAVSGAPGLPRRLKVAVLVNGQTASAAEILAGAMRDYHRGTLVGARTLGKGSVQSVIPLDDGSALSLTTAHYYTPNGICLDRTGLTPEIAAAGAPDQQLARALEVVRGAKIAR